MDLGDSLGMVPSEPSFEIVAELQPPYDVSDSPFYNPKGTVRLTLLQAPPRFSPDRSLPARARWMPVSAVIESLCAPQHETTSGKFKSDQIF